MHGQSLNHVKSQVDLKVHLKLQGQGLGPLLAMGQAVHHKMWVQCQVQVPQLTWTQVHQIWV